MPVFVVVKRRSYGGLGIGYLTEEIRTRAILRIQEVVDEARARSDTLMTKHQSALVMVATAVDEHRRLTDNRLDALLLSAGFTPSRPTAVFVSEMVFALRRLVLRRAPSAGPVTARPAHQADPCRTEVTTNASRHTSTTSGGVGTCQPGCAATTRQAPAQRSTAHRVSGEPERRRPRSRLNPGCEG